MNLPTVIDNLHDIADNVALLAGETYGQIIEEAVQVLRLIKVETENEFEKRDARIHELELQTQEQQRERDEAVRILKNRATGGFTYKYETDHQD